MRMRASGHICEGERKTTFYLATIIFIDERQYMFNCLQRNEPESGDNPIHGASDHGNPSDRALNGSQVVDVPELEKPRTCLHRTTTTTTTRDVCYLSVSAGLCKLQTLLSSSKSSLSFR